jgi:molybdenum cofactor cytidylyltransferase
MIMQLQAALNVRRGDVIAFTGAGGKTSALFRLGSELLGAGWRVIATTTTRIAAAELDIVPGSLRISENNLRREAITRTLNQHGFVFLYTGISGDHVLGLAPDQIAQLTDNVDSDVLLVEADGSRGLPFKAPYRHEPLIPDCASIVVPVVGFDALGELLDAAHVYNPQAMIERYGYAPNTRIKAPWLASVLRDPELGLKGVPDAARIVALINKVPGSSYARSRARGIARLALRESRIQAVAFGSVQGAVPVFESQRRIAAIVLAGGLSSRMGQPKVLMPWDGRPIIQVIVDKLKRARIDDIVVVTGHLAGKVRAALEGEPARLVHNAAYREGDMLSSLQAGLQAIGPEMSACMMVLGDQPQIDPRVISDVLSAYAEGRGAIIAPSYQKRRGHPIVIDRQFWPELLDLPPSGAPRDVINAHADRIGYVNVATDSILRDIDTPQDYTQERRRAGLDS